MKSIGKYLVSLIVCMALSVLILGAFREHPMTAIFLSTVLTFSIAHMKGK